mmetsp:Transcript_105668/g.169983  ORF Transcript_105668/g.169983 Transcript_105668/m.169983 type:complete len:1020 (+) Transcript_105668:17-3076(+)
MQNFQMDAHVLWTAILFSVTSISMIVLNKASAVMFPHVSIVLILQNSVTVAILAMTKNSRKMDFDVAQRWLPCACLFCLNLFSSMQCLVFVSVPTFTVLRNVQPLLASGFDFILTGQQTKFESLIYLLEMLAGATVYCSHDLGFDLRGYAWAAVHIVSMTLYSVWVKKQDSELNLTAQDMSYLNNILSIPGLSAICAVEFLSGSVSFEIVVEDALDCRSKFWCVLAITFSCVGGLCVSITAFQAQKFMSATSFLSLNNFSKMPAIFISFMLFGGYFSTATFHGMVISVVCALCYAVSTKNMTSRNMQSACALLAMSGMIWFKPDMNSRWTAMLRNSRISNPVQSVWSNTTVHLPHMWELVLLTDYPKHANRQNNKLAISSLRNSNSSLDVFKQWWCGALMKVDPPAQPTWGAGELARRCRYLNLSDHHIDTNARTMATSADGTPIFPSEHGQDRWMWLNHFQFLDRPPVYADFGAKDAIFTSNTFFLDFCLNARGVSVEANPMYKERHRTMRTSYFSEKCLSDKTEIVEFAFQNKSFSTKSGIHNDIKSYKGDKSKAVNILCATATDILTSANISTHYDVLDLDAEGSELRILKSIDFSRFQIDMIFTEANDSGAFNFLKMRGYKYWGKVGYDWVMLRPGFQLLSKTKSAPNKLSWSNSGRLTLPRCNTTRLRYFVRQRRDGSGSNLFHVIQSIAFSNWTGYEYGGQIGNANFLFYGLRTNDLVTFLGLRGVVRESWEALPESGIKKITPNHLDGFLQASSQDNSVDMLRILHNMQEMPVAPHCSRSILLESPKGTAFDIWLNVSFFVQYVGARSFDTFMPKSLQYALRRQAEPSIQKTLQTNCLFDKNIKRLSVTIQLRRGDVEKRRNQRDQNKFNPDSSVLAVLDIIQRIDPSADIHLFSDTEKRSASPTISNQKVYEKRGVKVHVDMPLHVVYSHFIAADVHVMDMSTISFTAAYLNPDGCIIRPKNKEAFFDQALKSFKFAHLSTWLDFRSEVAHHDLMRCFRVKRESLICNSIS